MRLTGGNLGLVVNTNTKKFALVADGSATLKGIDGFTVSGNAAVRINMLGTTVNETISTPAGDVAVVFSSAEEVQQVSGSVMLSISDFADASGTIVVEKTKAGPLTALTVRATDVTAFLGTGSATSTTSDDMGVRLSNGALDLLWTKDTVTDRSWYALGARGTASL
ncbi:MAG: hypothetical protein ACK6EB_22800, partial [Planctomyces sp.]